MKAYSTKTVKQLEVISEVKAKNHSAKRVNIVSVKLVKESSLLYKNRSIRSPQDGYELLKQFLGEVDREHFVVLCLDTKNQPTAIHTCHIGSLNASNCSSKGGNEASCSCQCSFYHCRA